jgi:imidazole glycerol-phosphate synthase subunit HisF
MLQVRVIPCLLLKDKGLVKTIRFKDPKYVGDPINAAWIFNKKEVDELIFLNIGANTAIPLDIVSKLSCECNMPLTYGGGIRTIDQVRMLFNSGVEKVSINTHAAEDPGFIREAAGIFGSQSIVVSIDALRHANGEYEVYTHGGTRPAGKDPVTFAIEMGSMGAGEIMINSIDRDGLMAGYDLELTRRVSSAVSIPVIACGGAGKPEDFASAISLGKASAAAAGSLFVFHGKRRAVLINYPARDELERLFSAGVSP